MAGEHGGEGLRLELGNHRRRCRKECCRDEQDGSGRCQINSVVGRSPLVVSKFVNGLIGFWPTTSDQRLTTLLASSWILGDLSGLKRLHAAPEHLRIRGLSSRNYPGPEPSKVVYTALYSAQ